MRRGAHEAAGALALLVAAALAAAPALAGKPPWAGGPKKAAHDHHEARSHGGFSAQQERAVADFYANQMRGGSCPPGLAKKRNGCMPPGQARKWQMGQPLPSDVVAYPLPQGLQVEIGVPPEGYRYVRVASDILMIAAGTNMVVSAITDLGQH